MSLWIFRKKNKTTSPVAPVDRRVERQKANVKPVPIKGDGDRLWTAENKPELSFEQKIDLGRQSVFQVEHPSLNAANELVRRVWDYYGPAAQTREVARDALHKFAGMRSDRIERLHVLKASIEIDTLNVEAAVKASRAILKRDESASTRMPAVLVAHLYRAGLVPGIWGETTDAVVNAMGRDESEFINLLSDRSKRICVVGSSPCEIGRGRGKEIDDHDVVIRFNNFDVSSDFAVDYGTKCNIWMRARGNTDIWRRPYSSFEWVLYSGSDIRLHAFNSADVVECYLHGGRPAHVPASLYSELAQSLKYGPSAGLTMCYWLRKLRGSPEEGNYSIFGISLDDQEPSRNNQYFHNTLKKPSYAHNWEAEAAFFKTHILAPR
ncbi:glycosyltransferase family 29 protein [Ciceribacter sp. L1K23]|uniref:glycosyltransferase family 29 protein n=1 Tax=Ciceribacter sp. L1K23 TaxID=2820276 RepID=UPI001B8155A0|nr:glycosyltransferase family 29 protein [Ciceribacter sp. L1K23]MBR0555757.1 glycosyltransferase family 29 protein [Ciceribacter sp. L1K23]